MKIFPSDNDWKRAVGARGFGFVLGCLPSGVEAPKKQIGFLFLLLLFIYCFIFLSFSISRRRTMSE